MDPTLVQASYDLVRDERFPGDPHHTSLTPGLSNPSIFTRPPTVTSSIAHQRSVIPSKRLPRSGLQPFTSEYPPSASSLRIETRDTPPYTPTFTICSSAPSSARSHAQLPESKHQLAQQIKSPSLLKPIWTTPIHQSNFDQDESESESDWGNQGTHLRSRFSSDGESDDELSSPTRPSLPFTDTNPGASTSKVTSRPSSQSLDPQSAHGSRGQEDLDVKARETRMMVTSDSNHTLGSLHPSSSTNWQYVHAWLSGL